MSVCVSRQLTRWIKGPLCEQERGAVGLLQLLHCKRTAATLCTLHTVCRRLYAADCVSHTADCRLQTVTAQCTMHNPPCTMQHLRPVSSGANQIQSISLNSSRSGMLARRASLIFGPHIAGELGRPLARNGWHAAQLHAVWRHTIRAKNGEQKYRLAKAAQRVMRRRLQLNGGATIGHN